MRIVAIVCNAVLFAITCLIVLTEGIPREPAYLTLTLLALSVPLLTLPVLLAGGRTRPQPKTGDAPPTTSVLINGVAVACNLLLVGFSCWAAIAQYPYAEGNSVIPFALLMVFTPIVSMAVLLRSRNRRTQGQQVGV